MRVSSRALDRNRIHSSFVRDLPSIQLRWIELSYFELLDEGRATFGKIVVEQALHFGAPVSVARVKFVRRLLVGMNIAPVIPPARRLGHDGQVERIRQVT